VGCDSACRALPFTYKETNILLIDVDASINYIISLILCDSLTYWRWIHYGNLWRRFRETTNSGPRNEWISYATGGRHETFGTSVDQGHGKEAEE
jgi:hypothetical protein